jgi:L-ascorbate 6-phosphate lactonase
MVHATWGDWFVRDEVEAATPDGAACWYLGCNGFVVRSAETTIYVDPYFADGDPPNLVRMVPVPVDPAAATDCDAVFATHEHVDHFHPPSYGPLVEDCGATLYAPGACFDGECDYGGDLRAPPARRERVSVGADIPVGDFVVHVRGANDPDAAQPVSYVFEHESGTFFHAGDSRPAPAFVDVAAEFDLDVGALAYGSIGHIAFPGEDAVRRTEWYMNENQVVEAANALALDRLVPTHWDMWKGMDADPKVLHEHVTSHAYPRVLERPTVGDRLDFGTPGVVQPESLR